MIRVVILQVLILVTIIIKLNLILVSTKHVPTNKFLVPCVFVSFFGLFLYFS